MNLVYSLFWILFFCGPALSSHALDVLPDVAPNRQTQVIDLVFKVEDLQVKTEDLEGKIENLKIKETDLEIRIELAADVLFDFDKANIREQAKEPLKKVGNLIREKAKSTVRIEGHTDGKGSDSYNLKLSLKRADSVKIWLIQKEGLQGMKFSIAGLGAKNPVAPNTKPDGSDDPEGRQKNRRVEIIIAKN